MLNRELEHTLNEAFKEARSKRHEFMTVEHLLLALLDNDAAVAVLQACGADVLKLRKDLEEFVESTTPLISDVDGERETQPTLGFQRVLQRAVFHVQSSGKTEVTGANVLVAILSEQESQAVYFYGSKILRALMLLITSHTEFLKSLVLTNRQIKCLKIVMMVKIQVKVHLRDMPPILIVRRARVKLTL